MIFHHQSTKSTINDHLDKGYIECGSPICVYTRGTFDIGLSNNRIYLYDDMHMYLMKHGTVASYCNTYISNDSSIQTIHITFVAHFWSQKASIRYSPSVYKDNKLCKSYIYYDTYIETPMKIPIFYNMIDLLSFMFKNNKYRPLAMHRAYNLYDGKYGFMYKTDIQLIF